MNDDKDEGGLTGDDALASEYVVGVLPAEEREVVSRRIEADREFARLVDAWEARLAPLSDAIAPVEPPPSVKAAVDRRLGMAVVPNLAGRARLWTSLGFWRGLAVGALALLAVAIVAPVMNRTAPEATRQYVASLTASAGDMSFMAMYDVGDGMLSVKMMDGEQPQDHDLELWVVETGKPPMSMGVLPAGSAVRMPVKMPMRDMLKPGVMLAVSMEPMGGSKTGVPSGPVVASGDLRSI